MKLFFNNENCDFSPAQRDWANRRVSELLAQWGDPDGIDQQLVKSALDQANDFLPTDAELNK